VAQITQELSDMPDVVPSNARVGLVFDYDADFAWATQPHGEGLSYFGLILDTYRAMRALGLSIDILPSNTMNFSGYSVVAALGLMHMTKELKTALQGSNAQVLIGPRSGARDDEMSIPIPLPPAVPNLDVTVSHVESLRPDMPIALRAGGAVTRYREELTGQANIIEATEGGAPVVMQQANVSYIGAWLDHTAMKRVIKRACEQSGVQTMELPDGLRVRDAGHQRFWFNYNAHTVSFGDLQLPPAGVYREVLKPS
jgi:beta-galactosidase